MPGTSTASSSSPEPGRPRAPERPSEITRTLGELGLRPDRRLGQSFLADPFVADAEAALVGTAPGEAVVEVGGGLGILTEALLRRGLGPLTVIERDPRLAAHLERTFGAEVRVLRADALRDPLPEARAVVGNLPYSTGTAILTRLLRAGTPRVVGLLQREVVERLSAAPGSRVYGRLTVLAAALGRVEPFRTVPASAFVPEPLVESQLFTAERHPTPPMAVPVDGLEAVLDPLFSSRRKQLKNLLPRLGPRPDDLAERAGWPEDWPTRRPEELPPEAYFRLAEARVGPSRSATGGSRARAPGSRPSR